MKPEPTNQINNYLKKRRKITIIPPEIKKDKKDWTTEDFIKSLPLTIIIC